MSRGKVAFSILAWVACGGGHSVGMHALSDLYSSMP